MQGYVPHDATPAVERGRAPTQMRQLFVKRGVNSRADGSAYLESERGKVLAAVFGPRPSPKVACFFFLLSDGEREKPKNVSSLVCKEKEEEKEGRERVVHHLLL